MQAETRAWSPGRCLATVDRPVGRPDGPDAMAVGPAPGHGRELDSRDPAVVRRDAPVGHRDTAPGHHGTAMGPGAGLASRRATV